MVDLTGFDPAKDTVRSASQARSADPRRNKRTDRESLARELHDGAEEAGGYALVLPSGAESPVLTS
jgi:hypothetical protein